MLKIILLLALGLVLAACAVMRQEKFGSQPTGQRLERVEASPNYRDGGFQNTVPTPALAEGQSTLKIIFGGLFSDNTGLRPTAPLPTEHSDLRRLSEGGDAFVWLGHSSFFLRLGGRNILVDPVLSSYGSPFSFYNRTFPGTDLYSADDMPDIDYLLITHDHWDHLDYPSMTALLPKVKSVFLPLGVGEHLERWGYAPASLHELDWFEKAQPEAGLTLHLIPSRHFSGRTFTRNKALWGGFVLESGGRRLMLSGDSGYGPHFAELGQRFGSFDLVALDSGQYDSRWPYMHMNPQQVVQAAHDLHTKALLPAHTGRFTLARHPWKEPFERVSEEARGAEFSLVTPKMGETVGLDDLQRPFPQWWQGLE